MTGHRGCPKLSEMAPLVTEMLPNLVFVLMGSTANKFPYPYEESESSLYVASELAKTIIYKRSH
jgi:hypothetical protein